MPQISLLQNGYEVREDVLGGVVRFKQVNRHRQCLREGLKNMNPLQLPSIATLKSHCSAFVFLMSVTTGL
jgi:hypothetical protein